MNMGTQGLDAQQTQNILVFPSLTPHNDKMSAMRWSTQTFEGLQDTHKIFSWVQGSNTEKKNGRKILHRIDRAVSYGRQFRVSMMNWKNSC